jgi:hypothetical protein
LAFLAFWPLGTFGPFGLWGLFDLFGLLGLFGLWGLWGLLAFLAFFSLDNCFGFYFQIWAIFPNLLVMLLPTFTIVESIKQKLTVVSSNAHQAL